MLPRASLLSALLCAAAPAMAQPAPGPTVRTCRDIDWKVSTTLPAEADTHEFHLVYEDKATHGIQTLVRFARNFRMPAHTHSTDETFVVYKGKVEIEMNGATTVLGRGSYAVIPAGTVHAFRTKGWRAAQAVAIFSGPVDFKKQ